ncbi:MAG: hypothetical protein ACLU9V_02860 [Roseburia sp.]
MKFIPVECLIDFLNGKMDLSNDPMEHYGHYFQQTMAAVRTGEETLPYRVGTFYYGEGCTYCISLPRIKAKMKNVLWKNC